MAPVSNYSFKPTPEIKTFGERGHMAGKNLIICRGAMGQQPMPRPRPAAISKPELIPLKLASAACYSAFDSLSDLCDREDQPTSGRTFPSRADAEETRDAEQHGPTLGRDVWIHVRLAATKTKRHRAAFERARVETRSM